MNRLSIAAHTILIVLCALPQARAAGGFRFATMKKPAAPEVIKKQVRRSGEPRVGAMRATLAAILEELKKQEGSQEKLIGRLERLQRQVVMLGERVGTPKPRAAANRDEIVGHRRALEEKKKQITTLEQAVATGLDPALVTASMASLRSELGALEEAIASQEPKGRVDLATQIADLSSAIQGLSAAPAAPKVEETEPVVVETVAVEVAAEPEESYGLSFGLGIASMYSFRGANVFAQSSMTEQTLYLAPSFTWSIGDSGFSVGYWGAYQWTGEAHADLVAAGLGHEQDLILSYERDLAEDLSLSASLVYYFYPFAAEEDAGTSLPSYLEPSVSLCYTTAVDMNMQVAYFAGLQDALSDYRYLYLRPSVGKELQLRPEVGLSLGAGVGFKVFNDPSKMKDNVVDVAVDGVMSIALSDNFSVAPGVHMGWSNFGDLRAGDEFQIWGDLTFELSL